MRNPARQAIATFGNVTGKAMPSFLIVNADDYGYFNCVSRGILRSHARGIVTATGVMGNGPRVQDDAKLLREHGALDVGVHLNLTFGEPLSENFLRNAPQLIGRFPSKFELVRLMLIKAINNADVEVEWAAQIERCLAMGLHIQFLNSHEHVHMLPGLMKVMRRLAIRFDIQHIRKPTADSVQFWRPKTFVRDLALSILGGRTQSTSEYPNVRFMGLGASGRISIEYLEKQLKTLQRGQIFELMCHPGIYDKAEVLDPTLVQYHNWEQELDVLTSDEARALLELHNVELIGFRDIKNI